MDKYFGCGTFDFCTNPIAAGEDGRVSELCRAAALLSGFPWELMIRETNTIGIRRAADLAVTHWPMLEIPNEFVADHLVRLSRSAHPDGQPHPPLSEGGGKWPWLDFETCGWGWRYLPSFEEVKRKVKTNAELVASKVAI